MACGIAQCLDTADLGQAWIFAGTRFRTTIFIVSTVVVVVALRCSWFDDTLAVGCETVAVLHWANTATTLVNDHSAFECAHTAAGFVNLVAKFDAARLTVAVDVESTARWAHTIAVGVTNVAFVDATQRCCNRRGWI